MEKILIFHHYGGIGGAGLSLLHIVQSLVKEGRELIVYCPENPNEIANLLKKYDCKVIKTKKSPKIFPHYSGGIKNLLSVRTLKNLLDIFRDIPKIKSTIREVKPNIIVVNSMTLFWIGAIAKQFSIKTICFNRETYIKGILGFRTHLIKRGLSRWFDKVIFISNHDLQESKSVRSKKSVIYDRVDFTLFDNYSKEEAIEKLNLNKNTKYILYLGGFSNLKGSHVIMESFKYLKHMNVKLLFVGGENEEKFFLNKVKNILSVTSKTKTMNIYNRFGLENSVIFLPKTSKPEILYKASDVVVFPSTKPHQARPIYESGITKIPIVTTDFLETKEFATNNINAVTFELDNSKELAQKIKELLLDTDRAKEIVQNNYELTKKNHDLLTLSGDLEEIMFKN